MLGIMIMIVAARMDEIVGLWSKFEKKPHLLRDKITEKGYFLLFFSRKSSFWMNLLYVDVFYAIISKFQQSIQDKFQPWVIGILY